MKLNFTVFTVYLERILPLPEPGLRTVKILATKVDLYAMP